MRRDFAVIGIFVLALSGLSAFFSVGQKAGAAPAATITVNSAGDDPDASGGTGACATSTGECTLRAAIETAQAQAGADTIDFSADFVINLTGSLPELMETDLTIDGGGHSIEVNGDGIIENVFRINGQGIAVKNLRLYGSGSGYSNIWILDSAVEVEIVNNLIGDTTWRPGDADSGPNDLLNYPEVTIANGSVITGTATVGVYAVTVYEVLGDPTQPGGGGIFRGISLADGSGNWTIDLEPLGLAYKPAAFSAHNGTPDLFNLTSSPLSPATQLGCSLYLPVIQRE